jgi:hypothetical protein
MAAKISASRFRLLCREVAGKVSARRDRQVTSRDAVLRELLRRVESHLGRKPSNLAAGADGGAVIREELDRLFDASSGAAWGPIAEEELMAKVFPGGAPGDAAAASGDGGRHDAQ